MLDKWIDTFVGKHVSSLIARSVGPLIDDSRIWKSLRMVLATQGDQVNRPYEQSVWVYAANNAIASNIASVPFRLYDQRGKKNTIVESGQLYDLFQNPNPYMTQGQLFEAILIYLGLRGEAMVVMERPNVVSIPDEMWVLDPIYFTPEIFEGNLVGWSYEPSPNKKETYAPWEVIFFRYFNPYDMLRGMPPFKAAKMGIDQDWYASNYNRNFFLQGAAPAGFISVPGELTTEQYNRLLEQFEERHAGYKKMHKVGILESDAKWQDARMTQKDMDFIAGKRYNAEEVLACYKCNKVVLGLNQDVKSYEGINTIHRTFWQECLSPKIKYLKDVWRSKFFSKIDAGRVIGAFDMGQVSALKEDYFRKVEAANFLNKMGYNINAINARLQLGFEDVPWGNVWWVQSGIVPVTDWKEGINAVGGGSPSPIPPEKPSVKLPKKELENVEELGEITLKSLQNPEKVLRNAALWKRYLTRQQPQESLYLSKLKRYFFEQRSKLLHDLEEYAKAGNLYSIYNVLLETSKLRQLLLPLYVLSLKIGEEMLAEELNKPDFAFESDYFRNAMYLRSRSDKIPKQMVSSIHTRLMRTLNEGVEEKETTSQLEDRIKMLYNMVTNRTPLIARTESSNVLSAGRYIGMEIFDIKKHEWVTAADEKVRPTHAALDGVIVRVGQSFAEGVTLRYPGDLSAPIEEVAGCRCWTVVAEE